MERYANSVDAAPTTQRSNMMRSIKIKNTKPELDVRKLLRMLGKRYRLHPKNLPGRPDIVFRKTKKAIFVNGCFWHMHPNCRKAALPQTRREFWKNKLLANAARDESNISKLESMGWTVLVIWECEARNLEATELKLLSFMEDT